MVDGGKRFVFASFWLAVLWVISFHSPTVAAQARNAVTVQLQDMKGQPITGILLRAWRADILKPQYTARTAKDGSAILKLSPGRYYFTGNVSKLMRNPEYTTGIKNYGETTFYYISSPVEIGEEENQNSVLTIDSMNYIDVSDIGGLRGFQLEFSQKELGIRTTIGVGGQNKWLRLYLPTRFLYIAQELDGVLPIKWPFYAEPGLQLTISSSQ